MHFQFETTIERDDEALEVTVSAIYYPKEPYYREAVMIDRVRTIEGDDVAIDDDERDDLESMGMREAHAMQHHAIENKAEARREAREFGEEV